MRISTLVVGANVIHLHLQASESKLSVWYRQKHFPIQEQRGYSHWNARPPGSAGSNAELAFEYKGDLSPLS